MLGLPCAAKSFYHHPQFLPVIFTFHLSGGVKTWGNLQEVLFLVNFLSPSTQKGDLPFFFFRQGFISLPFWVIRLRPIVAFLYNKPQHGRAASKRIGPA